MITSSSYDPHSENKSAENTHIPSLTLRSSFVLTQFVKEEIQEIQVIFLPKRHHGLMDKFYDLGLFISYD